MQVDDELMARLEEQSQLALSPGEKSRLAAGIAEALGGMGRLAALEAGGAGECVQPFDAANIFRDDEPRPSLDRGLILGCAPEQNGEMIIAPRTVE